MLVASFTIVPGLCNMTSYTPIHMWNVHVDWDWPIYFTSESTPAFEETKCTAAPNTLCIGGMISRKKKKDMINGEEGYKKRSTQGIYWMSVECTTVAKKGVFNVAYSLLSSGWMWILFMCTGGELYGGNSQAFFCHPSQCKQVEDKPEGKNSLKKQKWASFPLVSFSKWSRRGQTTWL